MAHQGRSIKLHWYASLVAVATFVLIVAGGLVTSNDAGLAVPDWPLSFGRIMPEMVGGVFYEHGHRMIAATVGFLTIILALWLGRSESRAWVRRLGWAALATVVAQGLLGGLTVLLLLPTAVSVLHACLAQAFFCLVVMIAVITSRHWRATPALAELWEKKDFRVSVLMFGAIYLQLILGSILRHSGMMGGSKGAELVPGALIAHILGAVLVVCVSLVGVLRVAQSARSRAGVRLANSLFVLLAMQLMLGVGAYLVRLSIPNRVAPEPLHVMVTTSHVAMGALMLATALILSLQLAQSRPEEGIDGVAGAPLAGGRL